MGWGDSVLLYSWSKAHYVAQADLKLLLICPALPPECWDYRPAPHLVACKYFLRKHHIFSLKYVSFF